MPTPAISTHRSLGAVDNVGAINTSAVGLSCKAYQRGALTLLDFVCNATRLTMADGSTSGSGGIKLWTWPKGVVLPVSAALKGTLVTAVVSNNPFASATIVFSVGSATAAADSSLTSTEANYVPSTSAGALTTSTTSTAFTGAGPTTAATVLNGLSTASEIYLNCATGTDLGAETGYMEFTGLLRIAAFHSFAFEVSELS